MPADGVRVGGGFGYITSSILTSFQTAVHRIGPATVTTRQNLFYRNSANQVGVIDNGGQVTGRRRLPAPA